MFELERHGTKKLFSALTVLSTQDLSGVLLAGLASFGPLGVGWLACSELGQVLMANRTAEQIPNTRDGLELDSNGVLRYARMLDSTLPVKTVADAN
jgi:hypothetical protein